LYLGRWLLLCGAMFTLAETTVPTAITP